jgi:hypothetical protein
MTTTPSPLSSVSRWSEMLLEYLGRRAEGDRELIEFYSRLARHAPEDVRSLVGLILDEASHHHEVFQKMMSMVTGQSEFRHTGTEGLELDLSDWRTEGSFSLEAHRLAELQKRDLNDLNAIAQQLEPEGDDLFITLIIQLMELDAQKHIAVMEFIRRAAHRTS